MDWNNQRKRLGIIVFNLLLKNVWGFINFRGGVRVRIFYHKEGSGFRMNTKYSVPFEEPGLAVRKDT